MCEKPWSYFSVKGLNLDVFHSKNFPTDPWSIPQTPNQQFMVRNSFHLGVWGCLGYAPGVCWGSLRFTQTKNTLPETKIACEYIWIWGFPIGKSYSNHPFFGGELLVLGRVYPGNPGGLKWLVVEPTQLKNMLVKLEIFPKLGVKIKHVWNHHLEKYVKKATPPKFNSSPLKRYHPKREVIFQPSFFRGYVKLRGCNKYICHTFKHSKTFCLPKWADVPLSWPKTQLDVSIQSYCFTLVTSPYVWWASNRIVAVWIISLAHHVFNLSASIASKSDMFLNKSSCIIMQLHHIIPNMCANYANSTNLMTINSWISQVRHKLSFS